MKIATSLHYEILKSIWGGLNTNFFFFNTVTHNGTHIET